MKRGLFHSDETFFHKMCQEKKEEAGTKAISIQGTYTAKLLWYDFAKTQHTKCASKPTQQILLLYTNGVLWGLRGRGHSETSPPLKRVYISQIVCIMHPSLKVILVYVGYLQIK